VKVDAANELALLKAGGRFAPLPIAANRTQSRRFARASRIYFTGIISGMACRSNRR
jgi:hypothetical protein